jgi:ATP-binding cassette subfamily F protein uup
MHYASVDGLSKSYGIKPLFENLTFHIEEGDKIALVAKNGTGKSTLLKILSGNETADSGKVWIHKDVQVALFEQEPVLIDELSILDNIFHHKHPSIQAIREYEAASEAGDSDSIGRAINRMDEIGAWDFETKVKQILGKLRIEHLQEPVGRLSGGQRKRVALAKTLIDTGFEHKQVLLIMDEPTNHLDVSMVEWLENYLSQEKLTLLLVTHDRYFLDNVCNEIWEINDGLLYSYQGGYEDFLEKKTLRAESDSASVDKAKNQYRKELEWMRKQPRARTTKSKSRQDRFYQIEERANRNLEEGSIQLQVKMTRLGGKIAELKKVYKSFGENIILKGFDYTFKKGERIGIIGENGTGKSTFLRILQQQEEADSGKINIGETVVFGNYSQQGLLIKEDQRVIEFVKDIAEHFPLATGGSLSASQFLQLFLFSPDQQYTYISKLSGGEKRRLLILSILFRNPNFLILDEPTNDLDLQTLAVLENFLSEFQGCLLIVSHDRYFMDRLVDHLFVFEGAGKIVDYPGNYSQYRISLKKEENMQAGKKLENKKPNPSPALETDPSSKRRPGFKERREFETLEKEIEQLSAEKIRVSEQLNNSVLSYEELEKISHRYTELNRLLDEKETRWLELSE